MTATPELLELEAHYTPASKPPPPHLHPAHDERFTLLEGQMRVVLDGEQRTLAEGDVLEIPRGTTHTMWNPGPGPARMRWENRPGSRVGEWFERLDALTRAGHVNAKGIPKLAPMAALITEYRDVFRLAVGPDPLVRAVLAAIAPLGRRTLHSVR